MIVTGRCHQDGIVLGADTRATNDTVVADKNCEKIHYIAVSLRRPPGPVWGRRGPREGKRQREGRGADRKGDG